MLVLPGCFLTSGYGHAPVVVHQERAGFVQANGLQIALGAQHRHGLEVAVERRHAHAGGIGEGSHAWTFGVITVEQLQGPAYPREAALTQEDRPEGLTLARISHSTGSGTVSTREFSAS